MTTDAQEPIVLDIEGMTCASCVQKVEQALSGVDQVETAVVNLANRTAIVQTHDTDDVEPLIRAVQHVGYGAHQHAGGTPAGEEMRGYLRRLVVAVALTIPVLILSFGFPDDRWAMWLTWMLGHTRRVLRGLAVLPFRRTRGPSRDHDHGHAGGARRRGGVRLQRVRDRDERGGTLLRRRRGDRHVDPGRQDARGGRALVRRRRGADAARTSRQGGDGPRRGRRAARPDRGAAARQPRGRPAGGEDPGRRSRPGAVCRGWTCRC